MRKRKNVNRRSFLTIVTALASGILALPESLIASSTFNWPYPKRYSTLESNSANSISYPDTSDISDKVIFSVDKIRLSISQSNGSFEITDLLTNTIWYSNPFRSCFGELIMNFEGELVSVILNKCIIKHQNDSLEMSFHPLESLPSATLKITISRGNVVNSLIFSYEADPEIHAESVRLLDNGLWTSGSENGYVIIPVREGLLIPADSGLNFTHVFDTYAYEGCHMAMAGIVKDGATALITWTDPNTLVEINSKSPYPDRTSEKQILSTSVVVSRTSRWIQIRFCGYGDYNILAQAYRNSPHSEKFRIPWSEKFRKHPDDLKLVGACNVKLWEALSRTMNETSSEEISTTVNWTFDEAAQVAEHIKNDLMIDKCLFILGGWINRGYDNRHPDIMPPAPECGGEAALADCSKRVMNLGYLFCPHDNYQDIYRDSPSWDEDYIMKKPDGSLKIGGRWSGGTAYLLCSSKSLDLAKRSGNLPEVRKLTSANAYLTDTTFAAGLYECFDKNHPLTRSDDIFWKQALSDYAREIFGVFGSEDGREWGLPHGDFFEGTTGASGQSFHELEFKSKLGGFVVPLFEIIYRDGIAAFGKYDYRWEEAAEYVLQHIIFGRTLNYHSIPPHIYWKDYSENSSPGNSEMEVKALFVRGDNGWAEGLHPTDRFIKNTHEILGPLNTITFQMPLTNHKFLSKDRRIQQSIFHNGEDTVTATVNLGSSVYSHISQGGEEIFLPRYGFLIETQTFIAFHALNWNGIRYDSPPLFTLRSLDDKPLKNSAKMGVYHGFGDSRIRIGKSVRYVQREAELS